MSSPAAPRANGDISLSLPRVLAFASATIPGAILVSMLATFMPRFYASHIGLSLTAVGGTLALVRVVDTLLVDLPLGWFMDHTRTRIGRYRPWYIFGAPILMLGVYMLFNPPHGADKGYLFLWYLVFWVGFSIMALAHSAWAANIATTYNSRSRLFGWTIAVGVIGSIGLLILPIVTGGRIQPGKAESVPLIGTAILAFTVLMTALVTIVTPEPVSQNVHRGKVVWSDYWNIIARPTALRLVIGDLFLVLGPGLTSPIYLFFFHDAKGFSIGAATSLLIFYSAAALFGAPLWARLAQRFGKHRTLQAATVCYALAQAGLMAIPKGLFWPTAGGMFLVGGCASAFLLLVRAMLADYGDQLRLEQGVQRVSLLFSFVGVTQKLGSSLNVAISFFILEKVGYKAAEHVTNTPQAIFGLEMVYLFAPIVMVLIGGALFFGYSLDAKSHAEIRTALDARDAAAAVEPGVLAT